MGYWFLTLDFNKNNRTTDYQNINGNNIVDSEWKFNNHVVNSHLSRIGGRVDFVGGHPVLAYKAFFGFIGKPSVELPITDVTIYSDKGRFRMHLFLPRAKYT